MWLELLSMQCSNNFKISSQEWACRQTSIDDVHTITSNDSECPHDELHDHKTMKIKAWRAIWADKGLQAKAMISHAKMNVDLSHIAYDNVSPCKIAVLMQHNFPCNMGFMRDSSSRTHWSSRAGWLTVVRNHRPVSGQLPASMHLLYHHQALTRTDTTLIPTFRVQSMQWQLTPICRVSNSSAIVLRDAFVALLPIFFASQATIFALKSL